MVSNPKTGQPVVIWYGRKTRDSMPHHNVSGVVEIPSKGRPRNHLIRTAAGLVVVPAGNLQPIRGAFP